MHINKLQISNFCKVSGIVIDAQGKHVSITGPNASGKTSVVNALWATLRGKDAPDTPEPIHAGAERGSCILEIGDYIIERKWTQGGTSLVVTARDGTNIRSPQALLDGLLGRFSMDPVAFLRRKPQEQLSDVLNVMGIEPPVDRVRSIVGEKVDAFDGESADQYLRRLCADKTGMFYMRRAEANRQVDEKKKARVEAEILLSEMGGPPTADDMGQDATELHAQLRAANQRRLARQAAINDETNARNALWHAETAVKDAERAAKSSAVLIADIDKRIAELQKQRQEHVDAVTSWEGVVLTKKSELANSGHELSRKSKIVADTPDPTPEIDSLDAKIQESTRKTDLNARRQQMSDSVGRLEEEMNQAKERAESAERVLGALRQLSAKLLEGKDVGVEGLEVGSGELRLNGISFAQASFAERIKVACAVAMKQDPKLKVLRADDCEHLDSESRKQLLAMADANGWQVWMTMVSDQESIQVSIVDAESE